MNSTLCMLSCGQTSEKWVLGVDVLMWCALTEGKVLVANPTLNLTTPKCSIMKFDYPLLRNC